MLNGRDIVDYDSDNHLIKLDNGILIQYGFKLIADGEILELSSDFSSSPILLVSRDNAVNAKTNSGLYHHWVNESMNKFYIYCETHDSSDKIWLHYLAIGMWK